MPRRHTPGTLSPEPAPRPAGLLNLRHDPFSAEMKRIQRQRTKGWRMPEGAIYVGRPSRWGNPYSAGSGIPQDCCEYACYEDEGCTCDGCMSPAKAVALYLADIADQCAHDPGHADRWTAPLRGHDLACWCPLDQPCHADVLLELAAIG